MKRRFFSWLPFILLFSLIFINSSCTRSLKEQTLHNPQAQVNLLIAGDASEYKDALRQAIIQDYQPRANIRVVNIDKLNKIAPEAYDAVLIIDTCLAWTRFNPTVLSFLDRPEVKERVVWFMTVDDTEERYQHNGVDAITAASVTENTLEVADKLRRQLDTILSNR